MIAPDASGARELLERLWQEAHAPEHALSTVSLTGDAPLLASSFHVGTVAQSTIAGAALAANVIGEVRGSPLQGISVDMADAERECTGYFSLDGVVPKAWAPLSGLYPCADGHVRIHANFDHHRDGALKLLGIGGDPRKVNRADVAAALAGWKRIDFETAAAAKGLVVSAARSFDEWDQGQQSREVANTPLVAIEKIGEAEPRALAQTGSAAPPLAGIRVLDLTRILAGPVCGRTLAGYGADVMLVNSPHLPNIDAIVDTSRGKRSCHIDLAGREGQTQLSALLGESHLFIQGYRPGGLARLGFGPADCAAARPGIVYVSLSAYGHTGPWADRRGFDSLVQTATGFNLAEAEAFGSDSPRPMPVQILDFASGFLMAFGALVALYRQATEGGSWHVQVSLARTAHWLRSLGRVTGHLDAGPPRLDDHLVEYQSGFGRLAAMPHAAHFDRTPVRYPWPSAPPGTSAASWQAR